MYQAIYYDRKSSTIHLWDDDKGYINVPFKQYAYRPSSQGKYKSIHGTPLERTTRYNPNDTSLYESDVPPETRFLIDTYGDDDEPSKGHRIAVIDIEVDSKGGYPIVDEANKAITAIALYDSGLKRYYCWILDERNEVEPSNLDGVEVIPCADEETLLGQFLTKWEEITPTILTGWNITGFDVPYLYNRIARVLGEDDALRLSPVHIVTKNKLKGNTVIAGVNCLDYLTLYKWYDGKKLPNYRLDTVGKEELKEGKVHYEGSLDDLMKNDIKKFIEYNIHDVRIVVRLDEVKQFIQLAMDICHVCHVGYEDYNGSSKFLEGAVLTYLRRNRLVAPNKVRVPRDENFQRIEDDDDDDDVGFTGAYVKPPVPGRYEWVCSADINSLYPSTIMSLNISPETKVGKVEGWNSEEFIRKTLKTIKLNGYEYTCETFLDFIKEHNYAIGSNGAVYDQNKVGCIPSILKKWFSERVEFKKLQKKASDEKNKPQEVFWKRRQQVQKILLNSLYGVLGLPGFRFYDLDNAEAVTLSGQEIIKTSAKFVNARFNKRCKTVDKDYVIYIDTDSLYLDIKSVMDIEGVTDPKPFCIKIISETAADINAFYDTMMPRLFNSTGHRIRIADDVVASSAIWLAKKRYAMRKVYNMELSKDVNELEVKGLDVVRSSFPKRFRELMSNVLDDILNGIPKKDVDKRITDFKDNMVNLPVEEIAKNTSVRFQSKTEPKIDFDPRNRTPFTFIKGTPAQAKAGLGYNDVLKQFNQLDTEPILSGGKIKWTYLRDNPYGIDKLAFKDDGRDPKIVMDIIGTYIDRKSLWEKEMLTKLTDFYVAMNWSMFSSDQEKIDEFFSFDT